MEQAKQLKLFYTSGQSIIKFQNLRSSYSTNTELRKIQLQNLSNDLQNGSIEPAEAVEFINAEKQSSQTLINEMNGNTTTVRENIELFVRSLQPVEEVIKSRNFGNLPLVPKAL